MVCAFSQSIFASETVAAAFDSGSGNYRYEGQVLEVPKDQYEACVELMRKRIAQGKVPGFENPADAENIVQQGTVTYKQARNIARAGNVDSLVFDAKTQATSTMCLRRLRLPLPRIGRVRSELESSILEQYDTYHGDHKRTSYALRLLPKVGLFVAV